MINSQGYNIGNKGATFKGFESTDINRTKKYIMNTKKLLGTTEVNETLQKPVFDPYRTPEHRLEYSLYGGEYFCASDVKIYIGDIWVDDAIAIEYVMQEKVTPVYGYASHTYDDIARGQRLVSGSLSINFKSAGYMQNVLKYADAIMYAIKVGENEGTVKPIDFENLKLNELLVKLGKRSFEQIVQEYERALWGDVDEENDTVLNHDLMSYFPYSNLGFDVRIHFGPVDEVMKGDSLDYYKDTYGIKEPEYTVEVINGVQFTAVAKTISTEQQSIPIMETYMFMARDLNGISKDRFVAQMEFENMEEGGTMFGNANSSLIDAPYSEILGYEKSQYSIEGIKVGDTASSMVEVKYISNSSGDSAKFYVPEWGKEVDVRFIGIDAYNMDETDLEKKQFAADAKHHLQAVLTEGVTTLKLEFEADGSNKVTNTYGQYFAYVNADGDNINVTMARAGLAKLSHASLGIKRHRTAIHTAEKSARLAKKGIWATLPQEPHYDITSEELEAFFDLNPALTGSLTVEQWKEKNK